MSLACFKLSGATNIVVETTTVSSWRVEFFKTILHSKCYIDSFPLKARNLLNTFTILS